MASTLIPQIHHERQEPGSMLCAQHALNALLQGSYFDPSQLSDVAKQMDELERNQLGDEAWRSRDTQSLNMDDTGFFSVTVIERALEAYGLNLIRWRSETMRPYQSQPEEQLAFVLNLNSHWFTLRGFPNGYWFNLNSFLPRPEWVGPAYLGALLDEAETEGYSVFVVRVAGGSRSAFQSSPADECAATLPHVSIAGGGAVSSATSSANLGLKPQQSSDTGFEAGLGTAQADEDADLQAALRASLADADLNSNGGDSPSTNTFPSSFSTGQRRSRRAASGEDNDSEETEETDAHVDAIAPSRRRARPMGTASLTMPTSSSSAAAAAAATIGGRSFVLPTASGGRRRASRQHIVEDDDDGIRSTWDSNASSRRSGARHASGNRVDTAISVDDDDDDYNEGSLAPIGGRQEDEEDFEEIHNSAPRSPFLNPVLAQVAAAAAAAGSGSGGGGSGTASDEDFHSVSSGDADEEWAGLGESMTEGPVQDRTYDDEDAELQAALAASMRETGGGGGGAEAEETFPGLGADDDSTLIAAQMRAWNRGESNSPPPADVERIVRMRAEARQKEIEERERRERLERGETEEEPVAGKPARKDSQGNGAIDDDDDDDDEDEDEDNAPPPTAEEMRKARLARFGA